MKIIDDYLINRICVDEIVVISGIRHTDRVIDRSKSGRNYHGLLYIWNGGVSFYNSDSKRIDFSGGDLIYIPKYYKYVMRYSKDNTTFVVVDFDMFTKAGEELFLSENLEAVGKEDSAHTIANIMSKFELCGTSQNPSAYLRRKELMYRILTHIFQERLIEKSYDQKHQQIFAGVILLKQSYLENFPIDTFAKQSNMSTSHFRTLFKQQYGMSPLQYRNRLRIYRAKDLLEEGSCTVAEAAYASGFDNIGYFCRYYKRVTGETPSETKTNLI